ncbi:MAG: hypothetical protein HYV09_26540 [Deltaproteobacteria bacterium]|nr:hypothetical protein [Deltaproteobacteria bacterium]
MRDAFSRWGRISVKRREWFPLEYGTAAAGVHGWARDAFERAEREVAAGKTLPASNNLFRMTAEATGAAGSRLALIDAVRFASKIWATGILRVPRSNADYFVLTTDASSIYRGRPVVLGERSGMVFGFRLADALDGEPLELVAQREGLPDITALIRLRDQQRASIFAPFTAAESREQALVRVDVQRAIEAAERSDGLDWLISGPRIVDRAPTGTFDERRIEAVRSALRKGETLAVPTPPPLRDPADDVLPPAPPPEKPPKSEHLIALEEIAAQKREIDKLAVEIDKLAAARAGGAS